MTSYLIKRLALGVVTLWLMVSIVFFVMRILPGDVALAIVAGRGGGEVVRQEDVERVRAQLGLNRPLVAQYLDWTKDVVRLDFGTSLWTDQEVGSEMRTRVPLTLEMAALAMGFSLLIALPLGILSAIYRASWVDYVARSLAIVGVAIPGFWLGALLILGLVVYTSWLPPLGYANLWERPVANLKQFVFPALVLGFTQAGILARMIRSSLLEVLGQDYIRTAHAKGQRHRTVITRHALKNAMLPVVTLLGLEAGVLLSGTVIMENLFSIPGLGRMVVEAVQFRDWPVVQAIVFFIAGTYLIINLAVDLAYAWLDPRIRFS